MTTNRIDCDVAVLGAGFAGSLIALIARRLGHSVALLERDSHPRFAIGESSTPLANLKLEILAKRYSLDELLPLTKYGTWKASRPDIACGLKRGFSFFKHTQDQPFTSTPNHDRELLVAANPDAHHGDTQWYRPEFDTFVNQRARDAGVIYHDQCTIDNINHDDAWHIVGHDTTKDLHVTARYCIDATGSAAVLASRLQTAPPIEQITRSRTLFGHFRNVARWSDILNDLNISTTDHVFDSDDAALHHLIDDGWMWVLRFDNGITSAGFSLSPDRYPVDNANLPQDEWTNLVQRYPSIARQFDDALPAVPIRRTDRIQRRLATAADRHWLALPHTVGFVDPWLSPGLAHTLYGVERAARILESLDDAPRQSELIRDYQVRVAAEFDLIDRLTAACFANLNRFDILTSMSMPYFAAAITCEERIRAGQTERARSFLLADDSEFRQIVDTCCKSTEDPTCDAEQVANLIRDAIDPYNEADLCNPARRNMYPFTGTIQPVSI